MTYVKIGGTEYAAIINGKMIDSAWDNRESKAITTEELTSEDALAIFCDDASWSIVDRQMVEDPETHEEHEVVEEWDNSGFSVAGDVTYHRDGRITVKMGKPTDLELAYEELYG